MKTTTAPVIFCCILSSNLEIQQNISHTYFIVFNYNTVVFNINNIFKTRHWYVHNFDRICIVIQWIWYNLSQLFYNFLIYYKSAIKFKVINFLTNNIINFFWQIWLSILNKSHSLSSWNFHVHGIIVFPWSTHGQFKNWPWLNIEIILLNWILITCFYNMKDVNILYGTKC